MGIIRKKVRRKTEHIIIVLCKQHGIFTSGIQMSSSLLSTNKDYPVQWKHLRIRMNEWMNDGRHVKKYGLWSRKINVY